MKINVEVDVFEDYEFCNGSYHVPLPGTRKESLCRYWNNGFCYAFQEEIQLEAIEYLGHKRWMIKKCEPCKKAYKEAIENKNNKGWYCPECKEHVEGRHVTYEEYHNVCGCKVL